MGKRNGPRHPPYGPSYFPVKEPCSSASITVNLFRLTLAVVKVADRHPGGRTCNG